jgi:hypothetical protein
VVDLVQDDQRAPGQRAPPVHRGRHPDLGVGEHRAVEVGRGVHVGVAERRVELHADRAGRRRPLVLQVLGRGDHGDRLDRAVGQQLGGDPQRERGLPGARCGDREEVLVPPAQVLHEGPALPRPQRREPVQDRLVNAAW